MVTMTKSAVSRFHKVGSASSAHRTSSVLHTYLK